MGIQSEIKSDMESRFKSVQQPPELDDFTFGLQDMSTGDFKYGQPNPWKAENICTDEFDGPDATLKVTEELGRKLSAFSGSSLVWRRVPEILEKSDFDTCRTYYKGYTRFHWR